MPRYYNLADGSTPNIAEIRAQRPNMSIPEGADLSDLGYARLFETPRPADVPDMETYEVSPDFIDGAWRTVWVQSPMAPAARDAKLAAERAVFLKKVDADVDAIYTAVLGSRATEYALAEQDATAYKAADYTGTVPSTVGSWAIAKEWTPKQAADDILAQATAWRTAQAAMRLQRLTAKEQARNAAAPSALVPIRAAWAGFVAVITAQLGA